MPRQNFIEKRPVGFQQLQHTAILPQQVAKPQLRLLPHRPAQFLTKLHALGAKKLVPHRLPFILECRDSGVIVRLLGLINFPLNLLEALKRFLHRLLRARVPRLHNPGINAHTLNIA